MTRRFWSEQDCKTLLAMKAAGKSDRAIGAFFGVADKAAAMKYHKLRHPKEPKRKPAAMPVVKPLREPTKLIWRGAGMIWTDAQMVQLEELANAYTADGRRIQWHIIAAEVHHPVHSCQTRMSEIRGRRRDEEKRAQLRAIRLVHGTAPVTPAMTVEPPPPVKIVHVPDHSRSTSTAKLRMDAELRARIEILGITGGMLGDPEPGRSALDQKRSALA